MRLPACLPPLVLGLMAASACSRRAPELEVFNTIPEFTLTAHTKEEFSSRRELAGRVWIANFIFTTCTGPCPRMSTQMRQVQTGLAGSPGVRMVSFTVDPDRDTPEALDAYARRYNAEPGRWFFLTGARETLHDLSMKGFMLGSIAGNLDHSTRFALVDRQGRVRKYYSSHEPGSIPQLIEDARLLDAGPTS